MAAVHRFTRALALIVWAALAGMGAGMGYASAIPAPNPLPDPLLQAQGAPGQPALPLPPLLQPWVPWVLWGEDHRACPIRYDDSSKHLCFWPSAMQIDAGAKGAEFRFSVVVYNTEYVPLPGSGALWPQEVKGHDGAPLPVLDRKGVPVVLLQAGRHDLSGRFAWSVPPGSLKLPDTVGILNLTLHGTPVETPAWDTSGQLWLQREAAGDEAAQNFLSKKVYVLLEDGMPLWLTMKLELVVSGKSREEILGNVLPDGWKLTAVESPLPVAVDQAGSLKAQVRTGKWTITLRAMHLTSPAQIGFPAGVTPVEPDITLAFKAAPKLRTIDIEGIASVDVSQLNFPQEWRSYPIYRWETGTPFRLEERMRGMGGQRPPGLTLQRQLWLDEKGKELTFLDRIEGKAQEIWRLDALPRQKLGAVQGDGVGLLITLNPQTGTPGVELRNRDVNLQAIGQIAHPATIAATGWEADVEKATVSLNLPPGWRLFYLSGADFVSGDWVNSWTLLDLFLLLLFVLAIYRFWGVPLALLALVTLALCYKEPDSPRVLWLILLVPLALQHMLPLRGRGAQALALLKVICVGALLWTLYPFLIAQIRNGIYPQLEFSTTSQSFKEVEMATEMQIAASAPMVDAVSRARKMPKGYGLSSSPATREKLKAAKSAFEADPEAKVQTGPAIPHWSWRIVNYGWNGPVAKTQQVHFFFIPAWLERILMLARVVLSAALLGLLLLTTGRRRLPKGPSGATAAAAIATLLLAGAPGASAEAFPDETMLSTLRQRLVASPLYTEASADVATAWLRLDPASPQVEIEAEVHLGGLTAVPLPGKLAGWEAHSVTVDGSPEAALRRDDGFLWVVLPEGVHRVKIKGVLAAGMTDWEWAFLLKPRRVVVDAPGWKVSGLSAEGVPEQQLFLTREQKTEASSSEYDRVETHSVVRVERELQLGLTWQVQTTIKRLTPTGKAIALRIPLLPGENVITPDRPVEEGHMEVRLGAQVNEYQWVSELSFNEAITLTSHAGNPWVEQWSLQASPVWNVRLAGLAPIFAPGSQQLNPTWYPWPGESAELTVQRPKAQEGATLTVQSTHYTLEVGQRQRVSKIRLIVKCSLGEDFAVTLPAGAEVLNLTVDEQATPIRRNGDKLIVPLRAGRHVVAFDFREEKQLGFHTAASFITLPAASANTQVEIAMPSSRWLLYTYGPVMGPAVLYWSVLAAAIFSGLLLSRLRRTPLTVIDWVLLSIGMVQLSATHLIFPLLILLWLFLLDWRGRDQAQKLPAWGFNLLQLLLIGLTGASIITFAGITLSGLLSSPSMLIEGNGSYGNSLKWYQAASGTTLPQPGVYSLSLWWMRLFTLLWALWLANALIRWLGWGWQQFSSGGLFRAFTQSRLAPRNED